MAEYIDRKAVLDAIFPVDPENDGSDGCTVVMQNQTFTSADIEGIVCSIPAADVRTVVHARWEHDHTDMVGGNFAVVRCSACAYKAYAIADHIRNGNFCPNCGAQMDGGANH